MARSRAQSTSPVSRTIGLAAFVVLVVLGVLVATGLGTALDLGALNIVQRMASPPLVLAMGLVTTLGSEAIAVVLPFALAILWWRGLRWQAAELLVATGGAQVWNDVLKLVFHRERPSPVASIIPGQAYSFPSGHAMVSVAFYGTLAYLGWHLFRDTGRVLWTGLMALLIVTVGVSRLFLDVHYPTDVLASWAAGLVWVQITLGLGSVASRLWLTRPDAPP